MDEPLSGENVNEHLLTLSSFGMIRTAPDWGRVHESASSRRSARAPAMGCTSPRCGACCCGPSSSSHQRWRSGRCCRFSRPSSWVCKPMGTERCSACTSRTSRTHPELLEPDAIYELRLDLWATANMFLPGHRIPLEVSSSNFPRFGRNSCTGGDVANDSAAHYRPAMNRAFHDAAHASCLILPIIER